MTIQNRSEEFAVSWNPTITGLFMDVLGFLLIFALGGLGITGVHGFAESNTRKYLKYLGAFLIVVGFALQIVGAKSN